VLHHGTTVHPTEQLPNLAAARPRFHRRCCFDHWLRVAPLYRRLFFNQRHKSAYLSSSIWHVLKVVNSMNWTEMAVLKKQQLS
jgi:hypothetical protein